MQTNHVHTGALFKTKTVNKERPATLIGITRTNMALWPMRSATRDQ